MQNPFAYIKQSAADTVGRLTVGGALNPFLWLCGMAFLFLVPAAWYARDVGWFSGALLAIVAYCVIIASIAGLRFAFKNPELLQREDHQFRVQVLTLVKKGDVRGADVTALMSMSNPVSRPQVQTPNTEALQEKEVRAIEAEVVEREAK